MADKYKRLIYLLKGIVLSYMVSIALMLVFAFLITFTSISEGRIHLLNSIVIIVSIVIGSVYLAKMVEKEGWINGGLLGLFYYLSLSILAMIFVKSVNLDIFSISKLILAVTTGIIGGIIGINI